MVTKTAGFVLAALLASGTSVALGAPAQAAGAKCYAGTWRTVGLKAVIHGKAPTGFTQHVRYEGMAGIKVKLTRGKIVYDFTGSRREDFAGVGTDGRRVAGWERLTGVLQLPARITGDRKGRITSRYRKAYGKATGTGMSLKPVSASWGTWLVAAHARKGQFDSPVLKDARFSCEGKTLRIHDRRTWDTFSETVDLYLKRVR